jgi:cytochrome P450
VGTSTLPYGDKWRATRKFDHATLFKPDKVAIFIPLFLEHVQESIATLKDHQIVNASTFLKTTMMKTMSTLTWGSKARPEVIDQLVFYSDYLFWALLQPNLRDFFPLLRVFPEPELIRKSKDYTEKLHALISGINREIKDEMTSDGAVPSCFCESMYLHQKEHDIDDEQIKVLTQQVLLAGTDTTGTTLCWLILFLANHPTVQEKVAEELEAVDVDTVTFADREKVPYFINVIREAQRCGNVAPLLVPHSNPEPLEVEGYVIPADTMIYPLSYAWNTDPEIWGSNAEEFRPERWEQATPTQLSVPIAFGFGPRQCVGQPLAEQMVFLFAIHLLKNFKFVHPDGGKFDEAGVFGLTYSPKPFELAVSRR